MVDEGPDCIGVVRMAADFERPVFPVVAAFIDGTDLILQTFVPYKLRRECSLDIDTIIKGLRQLFIEADWSYKMDDPYREWVITAHVSFVKDWVKSADASPHA